MSSASACPSSLLLDEAAGFHAALDAALPPSRWRASTSQARHFSVATTRADGTVQRQPVTAPSSIDAALAAQEACGLGCVVRVQPAQQQEAA